MHVRYRWLQLQLRLRLGPAASRRGRVSRRAAPGPAGAAGGADLRAGRAPGRGGLAVPGPAGRLRPPPGVGELGDDQLRGLAVVEVPAVLRYRPGARPGGPGAAGPAGDP